MRTETRRPKPRRTEMRTPTAMHRVRWTRRGRSTPRCSAEPARGRRPLAVPAEQSADERRGAHHRDHGRAHGERRERAATAWLHRIHPAHGVRGVHGVVAGVRRSGALRQCGRRTRHRLPVEEQRHRRGRGRVVPRRGVGRHRVGRRPVAPQRHVRPDPQRIEVLRRRCLGLRGGPSRRPFRAPAAGHGGGSPLRCPVGSLRRSVVRTALRADLSGHCGSPPLELPAIMQSAAVTPQQAITVHCSQDGDVADPRRVLWPTS